MNPPKILINSAGNLREIPKESTWKIPLNFHMDSRFTYKPNFPVDSLPPLSAIPGDSPQNPCDFAHLGMWQGFRESSPRYSQKTNMMVDIETICTVEFRYIEGATPKIDLFQFFCKASQDYAINIARFKLSPPVKKSKDGHNLLQRSGNPACGTNIKGDNYKYTLMCQFQD